MPCCYQVPHSEPQVTAVQLSRSERCRRRAKRFAGASREVLFDLQGVCSLLPSGHAQELCGQCLDSVPSFQPGVQRCRGSIRSLPEQPQQRSAVCSAGTLSRCPHDFAAAANEVRCWITAPTATHRCHAHWVWDGDLQSIPTDCLRRVAVGPGRTGSGVHEWHGYTVRTLLPQLRRWECHGHTQDGRRWQQDNHVREPSGIR
jgi:hypothetical protein